MARRLSKEDFEATFDAFLKASGSSEDDTDKINELLKNPLKAKPKDGGFWWMKEDDKKKESSGSTAKSFLKSKKPVSTESVLKVTDTGSLSSKSPSGKITQNSLSKKNKGKVGREPSPGKSKSSRGRGPSDASMSKDSLEDKAESGTSTASVSEKSEEHEHHADRGVSRHPPDSSYDTTRESVTTDGAGSLIGSSASPSKLGFDTMDELAEKDKFFQDLENKANGSVDYSQLNRDLSATGTMFSPGMTVGGVVVVSDDDSGEASPLHANHVGQNEIGADVSFEKETSSHQKPSMLSRVSLMDSVDSTLNTTTSPQAPGKDNDISRETTSGQTMLDMPQTAGTVGAVGTATSREIEELHQAMREIGGWPSRADSRNATGSAPLSRKPTDRSVGQLLEEMDKIEERQKAIIAEENDFKLMSDYKSPRSPRTAALQRQGHSKEQETEKAFDNSHTEDTEVYNPVTAVSLSEKSSSKSTRKKVESTSSTPNNKNQESRGRKHSKGRYSHIQSSGYGKRSPEVTPRKSPSPSISPIRPTTRGRAVNSSLDSARSRQESLSPSPKRHPSEARHPSQTQPLPHPRPTQPPAEPPDRTVRMREDVLIEELKDLRTQLQEERQKTVRLIAERSTQERETTRQLEALRLDYEEQIFKLKQENFVLAARLKDVESQMSVKGSNEGGAGSMAGSDPPTREQVARLEKECKEQEELLARFQSENQRLYEDIRSKDKAAKATEEAMFKENQRLGVELTAVRSQLEQKETELRSKGIITSLAAQQQIAAGNPLPFSGTDPSRAALLELELRECKRQHENSLREMKALQQSRLELEKHVDALVLEREMIKKQLSAARQARPEEITEMEKKHREEVERLSRKLKWYAENQELLDKSAHIIKAKDEELNRLRQRLEDLQTETGKRLEENKIVAKQKAADAKKIQDLERQVREMEQILRRRHPNSLPALMLAAASASDSANPAGLRPMHTVEVLEKRVKKLEAELEAKDEEAGVLLRGMEQKYNVVKFEERVADLEAQLRLYKRYGEDGMKPYDHPHTHSVALERELDSTRERYKKQATELTNQVEKLTGELTKLRKQQDNAHRSEESRWLQMEAELRTQVAALQAAVEEKDKELHTVVATLEKQKNSSDKAHRKMRAAGENYGATGLYTYPEADHVRQTGRVYKPEDFTEQPDEKLARENQELHSKLEQLQLERDQQRVDLRRALAETEARARQTREDYERQIEAMKMAHDKELARQKAEQAVYNATSRVASLQSRCDSQEVMLQHLQRQLALKDTELEQAAALRKREAELRQQVETLQEKLRAAKKMQTPEMVHFEELEEKISRLTERHNKREQELEALLRSSQRLASQDLAEEVTKWRRMVEVKNLEICKFREELDAILGVLRELQRQGIKLPYVVPAAFS